MEPNFVSGKALIILLPLLLSLYKSKNCREIRSKSTFIVMKKWIKRSHHRWLRIRSKVNVNWWLLWKNFENQSRMFWKVGDTWKLKRLHILLWHAAPSSAFLAFKMSFQKQKQKKKSKKKRKEMEITGRDLFDQLCLSHRTHTKQHYHPRYHQQQSLKTANPEKYHKYEATCSETEKLRGRWSPPLVYLKKK